MAPASLRIYTESRFAPMVAQRARDVPTGVPARDNCRDPCCALCRRAIAVIPSFQAISSFQAGIAHAHRTVGDAASRPRRALNAQPVIFPELCVSHGGSSEVRSTRFSQYPVRCYAFGLISSWRHMAPNLPVAKGIRA
jgi:hypothetical protein